MGLLSNFFSEGYRTRIKKLQEENDRLRLGVSYEKAIAQTRADDLEDKAATATALREQIKQLKSVIETCAQVLDSAAKS